MAVFYFDNFTICDIQVQLGYMSDLLYQSIARTVAFFDIFDHSLTDRELYEYLHNPPQRPRLDFPTFFLRTRSFAENPTSIHYTNGMWHLPGRESLIHTRTERSIYFNQKFRILKRATRLFRKIPFIRAVFVCNTMAFNAADKDSDIDVLIIVRSGHMWTARLLTIVLLSAFRLRISHKRVADRICLSFYLADRSLNISKLRIAADDIYLSYWLRTLIPVYDPDELWDSITRANMELLSYFPYDHDRTPPLIHQLLHPYTPKHVVIRFAEELFSRSLGERIERASRALQRRKIMHNFPTLAHASDTRVVVNDSVLKFHENDRRIKYRDEWHIRCKQLGV